MAKIKFINVEKSFGKNKVIKKFNLEINDGEFTVLVGPSGCGKSTLLRMISGLEKIDKGTILLNKNIINDLLPSKRDMAMVFQSYALYPHMTVYNNMAFGLKLEKLTKDEIDSRVYDAAKILQIEELLQRKPKQLSGGQRQRVAIARAFLKDAPILILDEATSHLDALSESEVRGALDKLKEDRTTIIIAHRLSTIRNADNIIVLDGGSIKESGNHEQLLKKNGLYSQLVYKQMNFARG